ncbi:MAG: ATP-binding protein [Pseudomonadota bacterium]
MTDFYPRWQQSTIERMLNKRRILLLSGPRQCGKTTLARSLQSDDAAYLTLDDTTLEAAAQNDPHTFVKHQSKTLIIDEIQRVPSLLTAIKKVVDEDNRPGQYLLTGSANIQALPNVQESLAGRVSNIRLRPLSQGEQQQKTPSFLERAFSGHVDKGSEFYDRDTLLDIALSGGFPESLTLDSLERKAWHLDYIQAMLERDLKDIAKIQRQDAMRELVSVLAAWSSKFMDIASIGKGLSIRRPTVESYISALEALYLVERVRPWTKTDYERVGKQSKLFMTDCGLMASLLGWRMDQIRLDSDRSGKLIETFAFNELASQVDVHKPRYQLYHYRDREKREIDFIIEREDGALLCVEIKAGSSVKNNDFKHIHWFKKHLAKDNPVTGVILYSGEHIAAFGEGLWVVPFGELWR